MLTTAQKTALKAFIDADPVLSLIPNTSDGAYDLARLLDQPADPSKIVWRTSVPQDEIMTNGFDWVQVDNLSVGKARIWEWLFQNQALTMNPSKTNVRAGIDECWKGTAAMLAVRAAIYLHCKRPATRAEALFATGEGTDASPASMTLEGSLNWPEILEARSS